MQNKYKYTEKQNWFPSAILTEAEVPGVTFVCTCLPQIPPQLVQTQMQRGNMNKCNTNQKKSYLKCCYRNRATLLFLGWTGNKSRNPHK